MLGRCHSSMPAKHNAHREKGLIARRIARESAEIPDPHTYNAPHHLDFGTEERLPRPNMRRVPPGAQISELALYANVTSEPADV